MIATWKRSFGSFWPKQDRFFGPVTGIAPGDVALLNLSALGGMTLSTGILVLYADSESFTFMMPEGHMFAAWITFSAAHVQGGGPRAGAGGCCAPTTPSTRSGCH